MGARDIGYSEHIFTAIAVGVDAPALKLLREVLPRVFFRELPMDVSQLLKANDGQIPDMIFCGRLHDGLDLVDLAQGIRSVFADPPMYYVSSEREGFDRAALNKNGFADAYLLPMDKGVLGGLVAESPVDFKDVPLIDIEPGTVLEFDTYIYLPVNKKFIRFSSAGHALDPVRAKRLMDREVMTVHIPRDQVPAFQDFTARQLKKLAKMDGSESERRERMLAAARSLLSGVLSENAEIQDCAQIVKTFIADTSGEGGVMYEKMLKYTASGGDAYAHVSNVSALAALFAMGLGIGKVEEVALAGLLHDIGLADIPFEVQEKEILARSDEEQRKYQTHAALALKILKQRQLDLSTKVFAIIEQHHERWDGRGYPAELKGEAIYSESQLVAIADEFEYEMQVRPGKARQSARVTLERILDSDAYNPDLRQKLKDLLGLAGK